MLKKILLLTIFSLNIYCYRSYVRKPDHICAGQYMEIEDCFEDITDVQCVNGQRCLKRADNRGYFIIDEEDILDALQEYMAYNPPLEGKFYGGKILQKYYLMHETWLTIYGGTK